MTWRVMALATVVALTLSRIALAACKQDVQALYYMCKKTGTRNIGFVLDLSAASPTLWACFLSVREIGNPH